MTVGSALMSQALGTYLETMRTLNGIKPKQYAARADTYPNQIGKLISGETQLVGLEMARKLTKAVGGYWPDVWWIQEHEVDEAAAQLLAEARYAIQQGKALTTDQHAIITRLLDDPEVAKMVVMKIDNEGASN